MSKQNNQKLNVFLCYGLDFTFSKKKIIGAQNKPSLNIIVLV